MQYDRKSGTVITGGMVRNSAVVIMLVAAVLAGSSCGEKPADMVLRGGKIATVDSRFSMAEAVAITGGRFVYVGDDRNAGRFIGDRTVVIDLDGKLAVPGLIDAHAHLSGLGEKLETLDLTGTTNYRRIVDMVAEKRRTADAGDWILGVGWDQNDWTGKQFPVHDDLSAVSPDNPVWLQRIDGHAALANGRAMELAGISVRTPDPDGGTIVRNGSGEPTGVFIDNAMELVSRFIPPLTVQQRRERLLRAAAACLGAGVTGVHDAGVSLTTVDDYKALIDTGGLGIRVYAMLNDTGAADLETFFTEHKLLNYRGTNHLTVRSMKLLIDGALGSRGAALLEPYSDDPGNTGLMTTTYERVLQAARAALKTGFQINTHAIGDRGNRLVLDAYETALCEIPVRRHRFRIEHAQVVAPDDIPRFAELGVIPSMQPTHATSDMYWAEERLGPDRIKGAYIWKTFLDEGLAVPFGSDFPVESHNPMFGIYAAVTRSDLNGWPEGGWHPDQRVTREDALRGFTIRAACAAFQEDILGSIEVGKLADIVILSKDILTIPPEEIPSAVPLYTIVGGKILYRSPDVTAGHTGQSFGISGTP